MIGRKELVIAVLSASLVGSAIGLVGGVVFTRAALGVGPGSRPPLPGPPRPFRGSAARIRALTDQLDLDQAQAARIDSILERSRREYEALRESAQVEVERELRPAQRQAWRDMQRRFRRFRPHGWEPGRGGGD